MPEKPPKAVSLGCQLGSAEKCTDCGKAKGFRIAPKPLLYMMGRDGFEPSNKRLKDG